MKDSEAVHSLEPSEKQKSKRDHSIDPPATNQTDPPMDPVSPPRPPYGGPEGEGGRKS